MCMMFPTAVPLTVAKRFSRVIRKISHWTSSFLIHPIPLICRAALHTGRLRCFPSRLWAQPSDGECHWWRKGFHQLQMPSTGHQTCCGVQWSSFLRRICMLLSTRSQTPQRALFLMQAHRQQYRQLILARRQRKTVRKNEQSYDGPGCCIGQSSKFVACPSEKAASGLDQLGRDVDILPF